jgi:predicted dehydrogenase
MQTRRKFIGSVATGLAGSFAAGKVLSADEPLRIGVVGVGDRGTQLAREAIACPGAELAAFADIYTRRLADAAKLSPNAKLHTDYRQMLEDPSLDAVLIATPQHLHAECFIAAMDAGKHVYQEKAMAFTVEQAKLMRAAYQRAGGIAPVRVQVGHQSCSHGAVKDALNYLASGNVGHVTAIRAGMYRNTPHAKPQWTRPVYPDMTPETIDWNRFLGTAPARDFDADRYINWRLFQDYSGGNVHENLSQQLAFWYSVMDLDIPHAVTMTGGIYRWQDGREVPDTMNVVMEHETLLFSWDSGFGNNQLGVTENVLGTDGTICRGQQIRYLPQKVNRPDGIEMLGQTNTPPRAHMQNFLDSIRTGKQTNCPFDIGFRVSVTCSMAVESYYAGRTVRWDPVKEEIV